MYPLSYHSFSSAWQRYSRLSRAALADELAWDPALARDLNNGAVQASLALLDLGFPLAGSAVVRGGRHAGKRVCKGGDELAAVLASRYKPAEMHLSAQELSKLPDQLFGRRGLAIGLGGSPEGGLACLSSGGNGGSIAQAAARYHVIEAAFWPLS